eukprot:c20306_g1_i1.p1 GENE.c20306_g1_i1~~c20306_g1_i1.p1  ORF type:complete len:678 (-),score=263.66 c20306_g1_i1:76-2109(-)
MDESMSELWKRLVPIVQEWIDQSDQKVIPFGFNIDSNSKWKPVGLNPCIRITRYSPQDSFQIHRDSQFTPNTSLRSILTLLVYLDDNDGTTKFYHPKTPYSRIPGETAAEEIFRVGEENFDTIEVVPQKGSFSIFDHDTLHKGEKPSTPKHVIRTDIVFALEPSPETNKEKKEKETNKTEEQDNEENKNRNIAMSLYTEATNCAVEGKVEDAGLLYERGLSMRQVNRLNLKIEENKSSDNNSNLNNSADLEYIKYFDDFVRVIQHISINTKLLSEEDILALSATCKHLNVQMKVRKDIMKMKSEPSLEKVSKDFISSLRPPYIPNLVKRVGDECWFKFQDEDFFNKNFDDCIRVVAMYAIALFGHATDLDAVVVNYDPIRDSITVVDLEWLLGCTFHSLKCEGTILHLSHNGTIDKINRSFENQIHINSDISNITKKHTHGKKNSYFNNFVKLNLSNKSLLSQEGNGFFDDNDDSEPEVKPNPTQLKSITHSFEQSLKKSGTSHVYTEPGKYNSSVNIGNINETEISLFAQAQKKIPSFGHFDHVIGHGSSCVDRLSKRCKIKGLEKSYLHPCFGCDDDVNPFNIEKKSESRFSNIVFDFSSHELQKTQINKNNFRFNIKNRSTSTGFLHASFSWCGQLEFDFDTVCYAGRAAINQVSVIIEENGLIRTKYQTVTHL